MFFVVNFKKLFCSPVVCIKSFSTFYDNKKIVPSTYYRINLICYRKGVLKKVLIDVIEIQKNKMKQKK